jgi:hypothetical protein
MHAKTPQEQVSFCSGMSVAMMDEKDVDTCSSVALNFSRKPPKALMNVFTPGGTVGTARGSPRPWIGKKKYGV